MLITAKEFEACANSPSPIRSPPSPAIIPSFPSLALHHWLFFFFLNLYTRIRCSDYFQLEYKDSRNLLETVFSTKEKAIYLHICPLTNLEELNNRNKRKEMIIFLGNNLINLIFHLVATCEYIEPTEWYRICDSHQLPLYHSSSYIPSQKWVYVCMCVCVDEVKVHLPCCVIL